MKKTTLTLMAVCLLLLMAVGVQAQDWPNQEEVALRANLVEVQNNLADLQLRFPSSPDIPLFQEKRDYLIQLLEEYSVNGTADDVMLTRSEDKLGSAIHQEKMGATDNDESSAELPKDEKGMNAEQSQVWNLLQSTQNQLQRLQKSGADDATIKAYQSRVKTLQSKLGNQN